MVGGRGVRLTRESVVREGELFLSLDPRESRRRGTLELDVSIASAVRLEWLEELAPQSFRRVRRTQYDADRERVVAVNQLWYEDLLLREDAAPPADARKRRRPCSRRSGPAPGRSSATIRRRRPGSPDTTSSAWPSPNSIGPS